jgi:hypothetical protein
MLRPLVQGGGRTSATAGARFRTRMTASVSVAALQTPASDGGCRIKPAEKTRSAPAEVHARADVRDRLATGRPLATDEVDDFGAHA